MPNLKIRTTAPMRTMSEQTTVLDTECIGDIEFDEDDFIDAAVLDSTEIPDELKQWFPSEYVVVIFGPRGSGKDILLTRHLIIALRLNYPVFTNAILHPEVIGIKNKPAALDLQFLLRFDPAISGGVIGISEVNTWVKKKRAMATSNLIIGDFLTQLRKRGLRVFMTTQFNYLPTELVDQIDLEVHAQDLFFTEYGKEANLAKGTSFVYTYIDKSGLFTGQRGYQWTWGLRRAQDLWPLYETEQIFDPLEWAHRTAFKGGERVFDLDAGELYPADEAGLRAWERDVKAHSIALDKIISSFTSQGFMDMAEKHKAINMLPDRYVFSVHELRKGLTNLKGAKRKQAEGAYNELLTLASQGQLARFGPRHESIELARPVTVEQEE